MMNQCSNNNTASGDDDHNRDITGTIRHDDNIKTEVRDMNINPPIASHPPISTTPTSSSPLLPLSSSSSSEKSTTFLNNNCTDDSSQHLLLLRYKDCWSRYIVTPTRLMVVSPLIHVGTTIVSTVSHVAANIVLPIPSKVTHHHHHHHHHYINRQHQSQINQPTLSNQQENVTPNVITNSIETSSTTNHHKSSLTRTSSPSAVKTTTTSSFISPTKPNAIRLLDSYRIEAMQSRPDSFYDKSIIFPILNFVWKLIQRWYAYIQYMLQDIPILIWPIALIVTLYIPLFTLLIVPIITLLCHYGYQYYNTILIIPTPQRVIEMFEWIQSILQNWWNTFLGRTSSLLSTENESNNNDPEYRAVIRTRKHTALAASIATRHVIRQSKQQYKPMSKSI